MSRLFEFFNFKKRSIEPRPYSTLYYCKGDTLNIKDMIKEAEENLKRLRKEAIVPFLVSKLPKEEEKEPELSKKALNINNVLNGLIQLGWQSQAVDKLREVFSEILEEKLPPQAIVAYLPECTPIVLLSNPNSHSYRLNEVHFVAYPNQNVLMGSSGTTGNSFPRTTTLAWRYATEKEIEEFVSRLSVTAENYLLTKVKF